jgi:hypothetical protein
LSSRRTSATDQIGARLAELAPPDADPSAVADAIVEIVDLPHARGHSGATSTRPTTGP